MKTSAQFLFGLSGLAALPLVLFVFANIADACGAENLAQALAIPHIVVGGVLYLIGIRGGLVDTGGHWASLNIAGIALLYILPSIVFFWLGRQFNKD